MLKFLQRGRPFLAYICFFNLIFWNFSPFLWAAQVSVNISANVYFAQKTTFFVPTQPFIGNLVNPNGTNARLDFPQDSISGVANVKAVLASTAKETVVETMPLPTAKTAAKTFYEFTLTKTTDNSAITFFDQPVVLAFTYTDTDVSGIDINTLVAHRWNGNTWVPLNNSVVDTINKKIVASTQQFSLFGLIGLPGQTTTAPPPPAPPPPVISGGGGGGGFSAPSFFSPPTVVPPAPQTGVFFSGRAFPLSKVSVLKDGQLVVSSIAGPDANFNILVNGLSTGNYNFSVYGEDDKAQRTAAFSFPVYITQGSTATVSGIFLAPLIDVDKSEVKQGEPIAIFGKTLPSGKVNIAVNSLNEYFLDTQADKNGIYLINFDTAKLELGQHYTKSKVAADGLISSFSKIIGFKVGDKTQTVPPAATTPLKGDLNGDNRVNLIDFSISAFWYKRASPPKEIDLNKDGRVNLIDFSIMAFYWSG